MLRVDAALTAALAGRLPALFKFKHYVHGRGPYLFMSPV
jgi:hypothetical protein